MRLNLFYL